MRLLGLAREPGRNVGSRSCRSRMPAYLSLSGANRKTFGSSEPCRFRRLFGSIHSTSLSALATDRAMEAWYHPLIA